MKRTIESAFGLEPAEPSGPPKGIELLGLESLEGEADDAEVAESASSDPEDDSPGDDALLEQEELYEGISSESRPSGKREKD